MVMSFRKYNMFMLACFMGYLQKSGGNKVRSSCKVEDRICEFSLVLDEYTMMTYVKDTSMFSANEEAIIFATNGTTFTRDRRLCNKYTRLSKQETEKVPVGDGSYKIAFLFNSSLPGPPITVYRGQQVVVHVTNKLVNEGTTVHWHGLNMRNTPWMDGVAKLTQCPINPGETFTYRFIADTAGTYWYHSHYGTQRSMGAYGPLLVLDRSEEEKQEKRGNDPLPLFEDEFYLVVSDYFSKTSLEISRLVSMEAVSYFNGWTIPDQECFNSTKQTDGVDCGVIPFQAGVINGKGYQYDKETNQPINSGFPLEKFMVSKGGRYRFRLICTSMTFAFRISIDSHMLHVFESDGSNFQTKTVESIIISSGERYDFWIDANDPQALGSYWIRAETLEMYQNNRTIIPNHVEALLLYSESQEDVPNPVSKRMKCTYYQQCNILNCPYQITKAGTNCVALTELRVSDDSIETTETINRKQFDEHFLNFHFTRYGDGWKATVNGVQNVHYASPPQIYPPSDVQKRTTCSNDTCIGEFCKCTHQIDVQLGNVVQLVLFTTIQNPVGVLNGNPHNLHLHGNSFQVLKIGYPTYDNVTGFVTSRNEDFKCLTEFCNKAAWKNDSWNGGNIPGINKNGPFKDTVFVPVNGYVIIRFKADNPGYWFMHCHTEFHNEEGMSLIFKVGNEKEMNASPKDMNICGNFHMTSGEFLNMLQNPVSAGLTEDRMLEACETSLLNYELASTVLGCLVLFLLLTIILLLCYNNKTKNGGYAYIPSSAVDI